VSFLQGKEGRRGLLDGFTLAKHDLGKALPDKAIQIEGQGVVRLH
jgi:hypothetical protein